MTVENSDILTILYFDSGDKMSDSWRVGQLDRHGSLQIRRDNACKNGGK